MSRFPEAVVDDHVSTRLLEQVCLSRYADDLAAILIVAAHFPFRREHIPLLSALIDEDWHREHEHLVFTLEEFRSSKTVEALYQATLKTPEYLAYDDTRAMARNAVWAIGKIPFPEADEKLKVLANSDDPIIRRSALEQIERRGRAFLPPEPLTPRPAIPVGEIFHFATDCTTHVEGGFRLPRGQWREFVVVLVGGEQETSPRVLYQGPAVKWRYEDAGIRIEITRPELLTHEAVRGLLSEVLNVTNWSVVEPPGQPAGSTDK